MEISKRNEIDELKSSIKLWLQTHTKKDDETQSKVNK
jgi:hypothetical protein